MSTPPPPLLSNDYGHGCHEYTSTPLPYARHNIIRTPEPAKNKDISRSSPPAAVSHEVPNMQTSEDRSKYLSFYLIPFSLPTRALSDPTSSTPSIARMIIVLFVSLPYPVPPSHTRSHRITRTPNCKTEGRFYSGYVSLYLA